MEIENVKLEDIQAGNQQTLKKLEGFRSGLERLMNKKYKKTSNHEPPSHDTKTPPIKLEQNYFSTNSANSPNDNYNSVHPSPGGQFGFNSTLFRQIADDTAMISNPSALYKDETSSKFAYNSVPNTQFFSTSSKPSANNYYEPIVQNTESQSFARASKLFSEVDDIINKSKKSSKVPVKPIQKYFDKIQQNLSLSNLQDLDLNLSKSGINKIDQILKLSPKKDVNPSKLTRKEQGKHQDNARRISAKQELQNGNDFLKNYQRKSDSMKMPPLPPNFPKYDFQRNSFGMDTKEEKKGVSSQNFVDEILLNPVSKTPQKNSAKQNSVQIHRNKLKEALNERKKIIKEDGILDDSIELELSDEENIGMDSEQIEFAESKKKQEIKKLEAEKDSLMKELQAIEEELDRLQNQ